MMFELLVIDDCTNKFVYNGLDVDFGFRRADKSNYYHNVSSLM